MRRSTRSTEDNVPSCEWCGAPLPWFRKKKLPEGACWLCRFCLREWEDFFKTGEMVFREPRGGRKKWVA